ncbi:MAG: peptide deformylase [Oscillospiraceae bacterium]
MARRNIVIEGDEILRKKCRKVELFDEKLAQLIDDMSETMYDAQGVGLAAPQVGILKRIVVIDTGEGLIEMINPKIVAINGEQTGPEACLSCPGESFPVKRPAAVVAIAYDRNGTEIKVCGTNLLARAICHEIDHLDGILFKDKAEK